MAQSPTQLAAALYKKYGSKANVAREMLDLGYSVSEISKAVPMAYSQVHSIAKTQQPNKPKQSSAKLPQPMSQQPVSAAPTIDHNARHKDLARSILASTKVGELRTPGGHSSDRDAGPCINCGHDVVIREWEKGLMLVHVNVTSDEYLNVVQFCQAVPKKLVHA